MAIRPLVFAGLILGLCGSVAAAKGRAPKRPAQPTPQAVTLDGTITAVVPGEIALTTASKKSKDNKGGEKWLVAPQTQMRLVVNGTANADYLKSKQVIQFKAELDGDDKAKDKVTELSIVVSSKDNPQGVFADQGGGLSQPIDAGIAAEKDPKAPAKPKPQPKAQPKADPNDPAIGPPGKSRIVGEIRSIEDNHVMVRAGGRKIKFDLADLPTINFTSSDPKLVATGSKVVVHGEGVRTKTGNRCLAADMTVTLLQPLVGKKKPTKSDSSSAAETAGKPEKKTDAETKPDAETKAEPDAKADAKEDAKPEQTPPAAK